MRCPIITSHSSLPYPYIPARSVPGYTPPSAYLVMPSTMRAVDIKDGAGPATSLFINDSIPKPSPDPQQCLIRVKAFGLNRADTLQREGNYPVPPGASKILGLEFSGVVAEVGHGEDEEERHKWKEGDEVFGLLYGGGYAEYVVANKKMLVRKPKELSWEVCGGVCEVFFTALQALHLVGEYSPATHKSILWHAGASSVSIAGIQLSLRANEHTGDSSHASSPPPKVFATTRHDEKCDFCVEHLHATGAVNTTKNDGKWADEVKKLNDGKGMDLVIDYIGASYFQQNLDVLALDGRVVQLGTMGGTELPAKTDISGILRKRIRFQGSTLRSRDPEYQGKLRDLFEDKVLGGLVEGSIECKIEKVMSWQQIVEAHQLMESNKTKGKIVCTVD